MSGYSKDYNQISASTSKLGLQLLRRKKGIIGDDAWFITAHKCTDVLAVADGVGGWREIGVDPSQFSSNLMRQCKRLVEQEFGSCLTSKTSNINETFSPFKSQTLPTNAPRSNLNKKTPIEILSASYQALLENKNQSLIGSSTACIIMFNRESNLLHSANLGDSGFAIIRNNKIVHRSQEQQHYFNSPFQIAILPNHPSVLINRNNSNDNLNLLNDSPEMASTSSFELCEGDFVLVATDGLWDNLNEYALLFEISKIKSYSLEDLEKAAQRIAKKAIEYAFDPDYLSPFAIAARKNAINIRGGKPDDVTVLLARVSSR